MIKCIFLTDALKSKENYPPKNVTVVKLRILKKSYYSFLYLIIVFLLFGFSFMVLPNVGLAYNSLTITTNWTLSFYKKIISPLQGQHICNFSPTCSQFFKASVNKYGFLIGSIMGVDRLLRCNPSAWSYLDRYYYGIHNDRIYDPPENHYFKTSNYKYQISKSNWENLYPHRRPQISYNLPHSDAITAKLLKDLDFADFLFDNQDYLRAIGEYKRILFYLTPTDDNLKLKQYIQLKTAESYLKLKDYNRALFYFSQQENPYFYFGQARVYFEQGDYKKTRARLHLLENTQLDKERIILAGYSYYKERNFKTGAQFFEENKVKDTTNTIFIELAKYNGSNIKHRNQAVSILMSSVIPGLGQIYCGRFGDGLYSFITVIGSGLIAHHYYRNDDSRIKFSIFTFLTAYFWAGNVYGALISARDYNELQIRNYQTQIDNVISSFDFTQNYQYLIRDKSNKN
ncbi:MAG: membrane protein insertion efficiency factor YidD [candidate division WOR-3 bacterium]|nr:membrane protein insertion efficiency factor YidD [candidate division WOR-3 bacterium]